MFRKVALSVTVSVATETPIDTGKAESNWQLSLDFPKNYEIESYSIGSHGSTQQAVLQTTIANAESVANRFNNQFNTSIHITNNAKYIIDLNRGTSTQAPRGFVQTAMLSAINEVKLNPLIDNILVI
jgi:hypothetical protein